MNIKKYISKFSPVYKNHDIEYENNLYGYDRVELILLN